MDSIVHEVAKSQTLLSDFHFTSLLLPHVHCSIIYNSLDIEMTLVSIDWWMDEEKMRHTHIEWNIIHKKKEILPFVTT